MPDGAITNFEELRQHVGKQIGLGEWHLVTQAEIDAFADATNDHQWIHVDTERARDGPFGATIAHGFWTLSAATHIMGDAEGVQISLPGRMRVNYGVNRVRFINPVRVGKRIRTRTTLLSVDEITPTIVQHIAQITVEIEDETKPALVAEAITRTYLEPGA